MSERNPGSPDLLGPLIIAEQGSFFIGGVATATRALASGGYRPSNPTKPNEDEVTVGQMYVEYQVPVSDKKYLPVVMVHGGTLTAKSYQTTPDGRMGWNDYFLRRGRPVYLVDQVGRGRSGFDATPFNEVTMGLRRLEDQPGIFRIGNQTNWTLFRFGPSPGDPFSDTQFPVEFIDEFSKQAVPDFTLPLSHPNPNWEALATLTVKMGPTILLSHSQSMMFPIRSAIIDPTSIRGIVALEGLTIPASMAEPELAKLKGIPILFIYGDHLNDVPANASIWADSLARARQLVRQMKDFGLDATVLHLPDAGLSGNSHMFMMDKNNLRVADLILDWIDTRLK